MAFIIHTKKETQVYLFSKLFPSSQFEALERRLAALVCPELSRGRERLPAGQTGGHMALQLLAGVDHEVARLTARVHKLKPVHFLPVLLLIVVLVWGEAKVLVERLTVEVRPGVLDPVHQKEMFPPGRLGSEAGSTLEALEVGLAGLVLTDVGEEGGTVGLGEVAVRAGEGSPV